MADAEIERTTVEITPSTRSEHFTATGEVIKFDGFLRVYIEGRDDADSDDASATLPPISKGRVLEAASVTATERFTQQPPRYTEASLVKKMEELGIGRPSTYAPTISTIQQREYVEKGDNAGEERTIHAFTLAEGNITSATRTETAGADKGKLIPTDVGTIVNEFLEEYFPGIVDFNFTANIEERFDDIAEGKIQWPGVMTDFYDKFHPEIEKTMSMRLDHKVGERVLGTDPVSGKPVSVKIGRFGPLVQVGTGEDEEKPRFASLQKGQSMATITLDEALRLFEFPRVLGDYEDKEVTVAIGRFGPYVRHDGKFVSIPDSMAPAAVSLDEAIALIEEKRQAESKRLIKTFDEEEGLQVLNGRFGPYIARGKSNYKIPKTVTDPADITYEQALDIIAQQDAKPKKTVARGRAKKQTK